MSVFGIFYKVSQLFLSVKTAVSDGVVSHRFADKSTRTPCSNLCQLWIFFDFETPALVVGEMQMELVQVMQSHHIDINFQRIDREEMTAHVKVHATVAESWHVVDCALWKLDFCYICAYWKTFFKRLYAVENT